MSFKKVRVGDGGSESQNLIFECPQLGLACEITGNHAED